MPVPTSAVKVNPSTGALIDPPVATFAAANGLLTDGTSDAKNSVRVATTTNGTLATAFENGDTIDGIVLATSDRILIKNQSAPAENGIYVVAASGAPARSSDFDAWTEIVGAFVSVEAGTVNAGTQWLCNVVAGGTLGVTAITFVVPKNYVDLTTTQTVTGAKTLSNVTTINGLSIIDGNTGFSPVPSGSVFAITGPSPATIEFYGEGASGAYSFSAGGSTFGFDLAITNPTGLAQVILRAPVAVDVTLPTSGTLLSSAAIGVSVQAYDADLTTWAGITPGAGVATGILSRPVFATVATAAGTTTLTVTSASTQEATGSTTQTYTMPVVTTLVAGWATTFINKSTGNITLNSSGSNAIVVLAGGQSVTLVCKSISADTTPTAWDVVGLSPVLEFTATLASDQGLSDGIYETLVFQGATGPLAGALNGLTGVFTAPKAGTVIISGVAQYNVSNTSSYDMWAAIAYKLNGGSAIALVDCTGWVPGSGTNNGAVAMPFQFPVTVAASDTLEIVANMSDAGSGGTLSAVASGTSWTVKYQNP